MNRTPDLLITNELLYRLSYTGAPLEVLPMKLASKLRILTHIRNPARRGYIQLAAPVGCGVHPF